MIKIPRGRQKAEIEVKRSRFISIALQVKSPEEAKNVIAETKKQYPDANHLVYAFITGINRDVFGFSDDREPRGTAGRPVLEVLKGSSITDILLMVVRYFGGTKLGTGGLVKAYTESAQAVIEGLSTEEYTIKYVFSATLSYELYEPVKRKLEHFSAEVEHEDFGESITVRGTIPEKNLTHITDVLNEMSGGKIPLIFTEDTRR